MRHVVLAGGTGFVGRALASYLAARGDRVTVLTRGGLERSEGPIRFAPWDPPAAGPWAEAVEGADAVVNLAGEPVAQRWTRDAKSRIVASRLDSTRALVEAIGRASPRPPSFVCASAIGYYGPRPSDEALDEDAPPGQGFLADVTRRWEEAARAAAVHGARCAQVRTGVAFGRGGGALAPLVRPFKLFVGGPVGRGDQVLSWIHLDDLVGIYALAIDDARATGPINAVAPTPVTSEELARTLGHVLHRPSVVRTPAAAVELAMGEAAEIVTTGQRVVPARAQALGYSFAFPRLEPALRALLAR